MQIHRPVVFSARWTALTQAHSSSSSSSASLSLKYYLVVSLISAAQTLYTQFIFEAFLFASPFLSVQTKSEVPNESKKMQLQKVVVSLLSVVTLSVFGVEVFWVGARFLLFGTCAQHQRPPNNCYFNRNYKFYKRETVNAKKNYVWKQQRSRFSSHYFQLSFNDCNCAYDKRSTHKRNKRWHKQQSQSPFNSNFCINFRYLNYNKIWLRSGEQKKKTTKNSKNKKMVKILLFPHCFVFRLDCFALPNGIVAASKHAHAAKHISLSHKLWRMTKIKV